MAKSSKDITTFTGGLINAEEPSDSGEDDGFFNAENLEGIHKKGVLVPSGTLADRTLSIADIDGGGTSNTGVGYNVMQSDYNHIFTKMFHYGFDNDKGDIQILSEPRNGHNDWNKVHEPTFVSGVQGDVGFQPKGNAPSTTSASNSNDTPYNQLGVGNRLTVVDGYLLDASNLSQFQDPNGYTAMYMADADWDSTNTQRCEDVFHVPLPEQTGLYGTWDADKTWEPNSLYYVTYNYELMHQQSFTGSVIGTRSTGSGRVAYIDPSYGHSLSLSYGNSLALNYGNPFKNIARQSGRPMRPWGAENYNTDLKGCYFETGPAGAMTEAGGPDMTRPMMFFSVVYDDHFGAGSYGTNKMYLALYEMACYKVTSAESTQLFFTGSSKGKSYLYQNEETSVSKSIDLYTTVSTGDHPGNDPDYLFTSNAVRIQGTDFTLPADLLGSQWYGLINRTFFKDVGTQDPSLPFHSANLMAGKIYGGSYPGDIDRASIADYISECKRDTASIDYTKDKEFKVYGWHLSTGALEAPDPICCTMVNVDDGYREGTLVNGAYYQSYYNQDDEVQDALLGNRGTNHAQDLMAGDGTYFQYWKNIYEGSGAQYLLRLEYSVTKKHATPGSPADSDITGTWNEAADTLAPEDKETDKTYRFYCSFIYDYGAQESNMTRIEIIAQAGDNCRWGSELTTYGHPTINEKYTAEAPTGNPQNQGLNDPRNEITLKGWEDDSDGSLAPINMHDTSLAFRAVIIPSRQGPGFGKNYLSHFEPSGTSNWGLPIRCTGVNYWYSSSEDSHSARWKLMECDFSRGIKPASSLNASYMNWRLMRYAWMGYANKNAGMGSLTANYALDNNNTSHGGTNVWVTRYDWFEGYSHTANKERSGMLQFPDPPKFEDWNSMYGTSPDTAKDIRYKTSTVIGGQAFYGNVMIDGEQYRDRILVSISNGGYDMIPHDNYLEVSAGDGDEIVQLLSYNEKLYVFKKRSLQIVQVGEEDDQSLASSSIGGIFKKHHSVATNIGIMWANEYGVFLNTGEETENLIQGKINDFVLDNSKDFVMGYSPRYNRVYILTSTQKSVSKILYMIDTNDKTWWKSVGAAETGSAYSNFVMDKDMKLTILKDIDTGTADRQEWDPTPTSQSVLFEVGDLNLDGVTSKKQLYSIVTVAKNASSLSIIAEQTNESGVKTAVNLTPANLSAASSGYGRVEHVVQQDTAEDLIFANATISGVADANMEIHSISFIYRDKGVK